MNDKWKDECQDERWMNKWISGEWKDEFLDEWWMKGWKFGWMMNE